MKIVLEIGRGLKANLRFFLEEQKMRYYRIGDYLKFEFMERFEINQNMLAVALRVESSRINEIVRNRRRITPNTDLRLCRFFGLKNGHFLDVQKEMELREELEKVDGELKKIVPYKELKKGENIDIEWV